MKILLVTPPMSMLNTPYPATAYLSGFLRERGLEVDQADWSLELADRLLCRTGLERVKERLERQPSTASATVRLAHFAKRRLPRKTFGRLARLLTTVGRSTRGSAAVHRLQRQVREEGGDRWVRREHFLSEFDRYHETVEPVMAFLRRTNPSLRGEIAAGDYLPVGVRLRSVADANRDRAARRQFEELSEHWRACYLATQYMFELGEVVGDVEREFTLRSYGDVVAQQGEFDVVLRFLDQEEDGLIAEMLDEITTEALEHERPDLLCLTVPYPGNLIGALRIAQIARRRLPDLRIAMGGGYPNNFLREVSDPRLFDFVDFLTLDDGERPLACLLEYLEGKRGPEALKRTFLRSEGKVVYCNGALEPDIPFANAATPSYAPLSFDRYLETLYSPTKVERVASKPWNSLTLAHGCYWRKCTFCDISLDYIQRYEPQRADRLVDQIETIVAETGVKGFHWVDEAAPPAVLRALSRRLLERGVEISWWGNVRFDRAFTPDLTKLMREAGCIMVTGGLEVASDRLLKLIQKGTTVAQVARVTKAFSEAGVLVKAYLMYGFPTQTVQETVDSLEYVRQLFAEGCLESGFWHRTTANEHAPLGMHPEDFGIELRPRAAPPADRVFGKYSIPFVDPTPADHDALGRRLWSAIKQYHAGLGLDRPVHEWFPETVPPTTIAPNAIARALETAKSGKRARSAPSVLSESTAEVKPGMES